MKKPAKATVHVGLASDVSVIFPVWEDRPTAKSEKRAGPTKKKGKDQRDRKAR